MCTSAAGGTRRSSWQQVSGSSSSVGSGSWYSAGRQPYPDVQLQQASACTQLSHAACLQRLIAHQGFTARMLTALDDDAALTILAYPRCSVQTVQAFRVWAVVDSPS